MISTRVLKRSFVLVFVLASTAWAAAEPALAEAKHRLVGQITGLNVAGKLVEVDHAEYRLRLGVYGSVPAQTLKVGDYVLFELDGESGRVVEVLDPNDVQ